MNLASFPLAAPVAVPSSHWDGSLAVDLFAPDLTPVLAVFDGWANPYAVPEGGNALSLVADDGTTAYYAHLAAPGVAGRVAAGDVIGYEGHTGNADKGGGAADSHLHFALGSSPDVIAARNGSGDIPPWAVLLGPTLGPTAPAPGPFGILGPTLPTGPSAPAGSSGFGTAAARLPWGIVLVVVAAMLVAEAVYEG